MASYPQWPPTSGSPTSQPSAYAAAAAAAPPPPPPPPPPTAAAAATQGMVLPPDLQALNITPQQLVALLAHLQAGTLPLPPPPPPPQPFTSAAPFPPTPVASFSAPNASEHSIRMDLDREEGEVSDVAHDLRRTPPSSSRKRKLRANPLAARSSQPSLGQATVHSASVIDMTNVSDASLRQKKEYALPFIAALHGEGFTFDEFVREGFEESLLRQVFQELQIPPYLVTAAPQGGPAQTQQSTTAFAKSSANQLGEPANTAVLQETANKAVETAKAPAPAKPAAPLSRQDYLARLQAAKTKKSDAATTNSSARPSTVLGTGSAISVNVPATAVVSQPSGAVDVVQNKPKGAAQTQGSIQPSSESVAKPLTAMQSKQSQTTELIRKRMEALKATQRRLANKTSTTSSLPLVSIASHSASHAPPKSTSTPLPASTTPTPLSTTQGGTLPGLIPGLYMSTSTAKSPQAEISTQPSGSATPSMSTTSAAPAMFSQSASPQPPLVLPVTRSIPSTKRPVASDLNEAQGPVDIQPFKRPFGQSRRNSFEEAMIIQVSDDEDTSSDEDDELSLAKSSGQTSVKPDKLRDRNIRDLPPLRDFPQRSVFNRQQGISTPPLGTPGMSSDGEELKKKEQEITSLNLRIKEYEKRKAALKAKALLEQRLSQSSSHATQRSDTPSVTSTPNLGLVNPVPSAPVPAITEEPKHSPSDNRRSELRAALSARDADILDQKVKIQEMQRQVAEMQRQHDENMQKQEKLRGELESLDIDTNGMTQSQMVAKKQEMDDLLHKETTANSMSTNSVSESSSMLQTVPAPLSQGSGPTNVMSKEQDDPDVSMSDGDYEPSLSLPEQNPCSQPSAATLAPLSPSKSPSEGEEGSSMSESSSSEDDVSEQLQTNGQETSAEIPASPESGLVTADASEMVESVRSVPADDNSDYVWLFLQNIPLKSTVNDIRSLFSAFEVVDIRYPISDDNGGPDTKSGYVKLSMLQAVTAIDQLDGKTLHSHRISLQMSPSESKPNSSLSETDSDDEMDISESSSDESEEDEGEIVQLPDESVKGNAQSNVERADSMEDDDSEDDDDDRMDLESSESSSRASSPKAGPVSASSASSQITNTRSPNVADDLAPELQPQVQQHIQIPQAAKSSIESSVNQGFKPYESLLKNFKGYRFHPDFSREVQGGYRSLTYSHHIDPNKELCRFEVASGVCNDTSCDGQHFRDMTLSDDELLLQMGITSGNPGKTEEDAIRYRDGLRSVLHQMREEGNLQTEAVAERVAKYRRDFVQDPSNILGL